MYFSAPGPTYVSSWIEESCTVLSMSYTLLSFHLLVSLLFISVFTSPYLYIRSDFSVKSRGGMDGVVIRVRY